MGDNLDLPERDAIRTPMQWDGTKGAGFSRADPPRFVAPLVEEGPYAYKLVNVTSQRLDPNSLLTWFERTLHALRECEEIGSGDHEVLDVCPPQVLVHRATGRTGPRCSCTTWPSSHAPSSSAPNGTRSMRRSDRKSTR